MVEGNYETIVTMDTSSVKFGPGVTQELGFELSRLGVTNVMLVTDQVMSKHESVDQAISEAKLLIRKKTTTPFKDRDQQ